MKKLGWAILLLLIYVAVVKLPLLLSELGGSEQSITIAHILVRVVLIVWSLFLIRRYAIKGAGLQLFYSRHPFLSLATLAFAAFLLYQVFETFASSVLFSEKALLLLLMALSVGFAEELFLRGFTQNYLMQQNPEASKIKMIFVTSLLFGLAHYTNLLERSFLETTSQVLIAAALGFLFGCLLYKTQNIYPLALLHAFIDFGSYMDREFRASTPQDLNLTMQQVMVKLGTSLIVSLIIIGIGFLVLRWPFRKVKKTAVQI